MLKQSDHLHNRCNTIKFYIKAALNKGAAIDQIAYEYMIPQSAIWSV